MADRVLLAFDTSTDVGTVAAGSPSAVSAEAALHVAGGHSSALLPAIETVLGWARTEREEIGGIVVGAGPGSFTGLRIAAATAKSLARALGVPLYAYSSLLVTAAAHRDWPGPVVSMFDARRSEVFWAAYRFGETGIRMVGAPAVGPVEDVLPSLEGGRQALVVGPGAARYAKVLRAGGWTVSAAGDGPRAGALLWLRGTNAPGGEIEAPARWEPDYLRSSGAERIRKAAGGG